MGTAKQGIQMKINEQAVLPFLPKDLNKRVNQTEFEQWINTPAKQNSGDEYYWQHQEQLQNSSLNFEKHLLEQQGHESTIAKEKLSTHSSSSLQPSVENHSSLALTNEPVAHANNAKSYLFSPSQHYLKQNQEPYQQPIAVTTSLAKNRAIESLKAKETDIVQYTMPQTPIKNHHLYIQNDEVELSLNTQELNRIEEQELRQMIQLNLKIKGLSLKQLLINGVKK
jgi:hypothetical protein